MRIAENRVHVDSLCPTIDVVYMRRYDDQIQHSGSSTVWCKFAASAAAAAVLISRIVSGLDVQLVERRDAAAGFLRHNLKTRVVAFVPNANLHRPICAKPATFCLYFSLIFISTHIADQFGAFRSFLGVCIDWAGPLNNSRRRSATASFPLSCLIYQRFIRESFLVIFGQGLSVDY